MHITKSWFNLVRHDDPPADPPPADPPAPEPTDEPSDTDAEPDPDDKGKPAEKDLSAEVAKWKALARKHEGNAKTNAAAAKKLSEIEDANKTEAERLAAAKDAAEARAVAAINRAVAAEIKVLASAAEFADPTDAEAAIKPAEFVDDKGEIDVDGIKTRLAELLESKPHWRKQATPPTAAKTPKPDPGQGSRGEPKTVDFRTASKEDYNAELMRMGVKPRSL